MPFARSVDPPRWAPLAVQYADYALWQREILGAEDDPDSVLSKQLAYWKRTLAGLAEVLDLPTDRPRPVRATMRGGEHQFVLDTRLTGRLENVAREHNSTLFMALHAAFAVLLARLSGSDDVAVGAPVAGRGERALDDMIGMFVNTVVLRTQVDPTMTFAELLAEVRDRDLAAFGNADVPFEQVADALVGRRSAAYAPLVQVLLTFQNVVPYSLQLSGLEVAELEGSFEHAKFDLQLTAREDFEASEQASRLLLTFTFATDLFERETVVRFAERFVRVVDAVTDDPTAALRSVDISSSAERSRLRVVRTTPSRSCRRSSPPPPGSCRTRSSCPVATPESLTGSSIRSSVR